MHQAMFPIQMPFKLAIDNFLVLLLLEREKINMYYLIQNDLNQPRATHNLLQALRLSNEEYWIGTHFLYLQRKSLVLMERRWVKKKCRTAMNGMRTLVMVGMQHANS